MANTTTQATPEPQRAELILAGGGHAHLFVLEALAQRSRHNLHITLINPSRWQHYSGMLPGWIAGHYRLDECRIDLLALAQRTGATLVEDALIGMDADARSVKLGDGRQLQYDLLSLDTGSETDVSGLTALGERLVTIKPLQGFSQAWADILAQAERQPDYRLIVMGGGAGGVEVALAASHAIRQRQPGASTCLVAGDSGILPSLAVSTRRHITAALQRAGVQIVTQRGAGHADGLLLTDGSVLPANHIIAVTGARAPAWLAHSRLQCDADGYIAVNAQHRSLSHASVFAAGDVCARSDAALARSGVHAVRAGPVLARNLLAMLDSMCVTPPAQAALTSYMPRRNSLYLLATGDGRAVANWGNFGAEGRWVWRLKDWIDRRFIQRFSALAPAAHRQGPGDQV